MKIAIALLVFGFFLSGCSSVKRVNVMRGSCKAHEKLPNVDECISFEQ